MAAEGGHKAAVRVLLHAGFDCRVADEVLLLYERCASILAQTVTHKLADSCYI